MTRIRVALAAVLAGLLTAAAGTGPTAPPGLRSYVAAQRAEHGLPGVALAVVEDGRVADAAGFGSAGNGRPMTADTPTDIGSITKTITAVAVLQLVERGAIELDAPVRRYLPWFTVADPAASETITVRHLLNHTSGISELDAGDPGSLPADASPQDAVRALRSVPSSAPVGARYQYLNRGYVALALVVETASGGTYPEYVRENVFAPLGMTRSSADPHDLARSDLAQGHSRLFGFAVPRATPVLPSGMGHGGVTSTARDLARLLAALARAGELTGARVLSSASVAAMQTPPAGVPDAAYGFGWTVGTSPGGARIGSHSGGAATSSGAAVLLPDSGRGFVVLVGSQHLLDQWFGLAEMYGGATALLAGEAPPGGPSGRLVGLVLLAMFVVVLVGAVRGLLRLPRWRERSRTASHRRRLARDIAPQIAGPAVLLVGMFGAVPALLGRPVTLDWVGAYFLPDVILILAVAIAADLVQGAYKAAVVARVGVSRRANRGRPARVGAGGR